ncbi:MAG: AI-2E family transporter [Paracoccus sp. (in: a-proteobacteria)]
MFKKSDPLRGLLSIVLSLLLVALVGRFMVIGKSLLLPIVIAIISVYVLLAASDALGRFPLTCHLRERWRRLLVLALFLIAVIWLGGVMVSTANQVGSHIAEYEANLSRLYDELIWILGISTKPDLAQLLDGLRQALPLNEIAGMVLGSISSAAGLMFMVVVYAAFLISERGGFAHKIAVALPGERAERAGEIISNINNSISDYIAVKTLVNVILGVLSFVVMSAFGVDFALFWAILIALLNYIPYVGSLLGVVFPVLLSMAQFGSVERTIAIAVLLTLAQMWVGNSLEPRMVGRKVNMSPFIVLVALALWSTIWGVSGAILAIPLTSIIAIIMGSFESTRPFAVLLAQDVKPFESVSASRNHAAPHPPEPMEEASDQ